MPCSLSLYNSNSLVASFGIWEVFPCNPPQTSPTNPDLCHISPSLPPNIFQIHPLLHAFTMKLAISYCIIHCPKTWYLKTTKSVLYFIYFLESRIWEWLSWMILARGLSCSPMRCGPRLQSSESLTGAARPACNMAHSYGWGVCAGCWWKTLVSFYMKLSRKLLECPYHVAAGYCQHEWPMGEPIGVYSVYLAYLWKSHAIIFVWSYWLHISPI